MIIAKKGLVFDDVLFIPKHSKIRSRSQVDLTVRLKQFRFATPIIPANMVSIMGPDMIEFLYKNHSMALMHRFSSFEDQLTMVESMAQKYQDIMMYLGVSLGVQEHDKKAARQFFLSGVRIFCIDIAHGDSEHCIEMCRFVKKNYPDTLLIAGNIATAGGAARLWKAGADVVKCGIGNGASCSTRIETGNGFPQMSAISNVAEEKAKQEEKLKRKLYFIADGGIRSAGDAAKALAFADMVMIGGMFAGTDQANGDTVQHNGKTHKRYEGSSTHKDKHIEGVKGFVEYRGSAQTILDKLTQGIRSSCSYQGVSNLDDFKKNPEFVQMTSAGLVESHPHSVKVVFGTDV